jgi:glycosyltransferase involved in cell wall biosynthesis
MKKDAASNGPVDAKTDLARRLWEGYRKGGDLDAQGRPAKALRREGERRDVSAIVEGVREQPDSLGRRLEAIQNLVALGESALALDLLDDTEAQFRVETSEFAQLIRDEIGARRPTLERTAKGRRLGRRDEWSPALDRSLAGMARDARGVRREAHIYTVTFLDFAGQRVYPGGAERYIFDLAKVLATFGLRVVVYQGGHTEWERDIGGIHVVAVPWRGSIYELSIDFSSKSDAGVVNVYSPFTLAVASIWKPAIGICHGVYWDETGQNFVHDHVRRDVFSALLHLDECISVDTNAINVVRATRPDLAHSLTYVPNYVGEEFFAEPQRSPKRLRLLYPRRLYGPRGYWLLAEIVPFLIEKYPELDVIFLGDSDERERMNAAALVERYPGRVEHRTALPYEMVEHYRRADITVIPTVNSEGTSLSALEALAAGNAVVASDVGGLTNIIIDGFNGLLIRPTARDLRDAICALVEDPVLRQRLQNEGRRAARAFSKERWIRSWTRLLERHAPELKPREIPPARLPLHIIHVRTGGIAWSAEGKETLPRQRPHHLAQALASLGVRVSFIEDRKQERPIVERGGFLEVLGADALVYADTAVHYVYIAYQTWTLGSVGDQFRLSLSEKERERLAPAPPGGGHAVKDAKVWFDLIDDPAIHGDELYVAAVSLFLKHAHFVTTSSRVLMQRYAHLRPDIVLVENACWSGDFSGARPDDVRSADLTRGADAIRAKGQRLVGYVGAIASWFDFALVQRLSAERPNDHFLVVGPIAPEVAGDVARLSRAPNVTFTGAVPYDAVPCLIRRFDVAILPFRPSKVTDATNPLKLYEYLAAEVPVVATNLAELRLLACEDLSSHLRVCADAASFSSTLDELLTGTSRMRGHEARTFANANHWLQRALTVMEMLEGTPTPTRDEAEPALFHEYALRFARNTLTPSRIVRVATSTNRSSIGFGSREVERGDTLHLAFPLYAPRAGFFRLALVARLTRVPLLGIKWTVTFDDDVLWSSDKAEYAPGVNLIAVHEVRPGLHRVAIELTAQQSQSVRRGDGITVDEADFRDAPFSTLPSLMAVPRRHETNTRSSSLRREDDEMLVDLT